MLARLSETRLLLDIPFRGNREYVHSTDLFIALDNMAGRFLGPDAYLKTLSIRRLAHRQVAVQFRPDACAFGTFAFAARGWILEGWLVESRKAIARRITFDEASIARQVVSEHGQVLLKTPVQGYNAFEQLIVLFKLLCVQSRPGAWLFTAIDLDSPLSQHAALVVRRKQLVLNRMM